jgi:2-polyprenyl-3-methyl-5-hydroxy-6-metoxy-1,4-benzoquinol methylase
VIVAPKRDDVAVGAERVCNGCAAPVKDARLIICKSGFDLVSCPNCGLCYIANPPSPEAITALYAGDQEYHAPLMDPTHPEFARMSAIARRHLRIVLKSVRGGQLIDLGCSTGLFLHAVRDAGFAVQGLEFSPQRAAFARTHFGLEVANGALADQDYRPASFDVVTSFDVIEHVPDPMAELRRIYALLKPGGSVILSTPNIEGLFPRLSYRFAKWLGYWPHPEPPYHLYQFSVRTLSAMLAKAGFVPGRIDHVRIDLDYSFGNLQSWRRSPKMALYAMVFAPSAIAGPWLRQGDWFYIAAQKPAA